jgi:hypothetical protein
MKRILVITGHAHPKAEVEAVDAAGGFVTFARLNAAGNRVDSGGSVARFTPQAPLPKEHPTEPDVWGEVPDSVLIAAIENPPVHPLPVPAFVYRRQLLRELNARGIKRSQIKAMLGADEDALIEYEEAVTFERRHPLLVGLSVALSLSETEVDEIFRAAAAR